MKYQVGRATNGAWGWSQIVSDRQPETFRTMAQANAFADALSKKDQAEMRREYYEGLKRRTAR